MSDEQILKSIIESRANQKLRDQINEGQELSASSNEDNEAIKRYKQMSEAEQQAFRAKGWKND